MTPTIEEFLNDDLTPQVEDYEKIWRVFGEPSSEIEPEDVLRDLKGRVDDCYSEFKGDLDFNFPYIFNGRVLIDTLEYLRHIGVPDMLGWKCTHIIIREEGDDSESVYLGVSIKEKHIKYYIPEYTKYPCYIKPAEEEWDPNNGFFQKSGEYFILPLNISVTSLGEDLLKRARIIKAVESALIRSGKKKKRNTPRQ